jgi:hypothetical protein
MTATAPITDANPSVADMEAQVARFHDLQPTAHYIDSAIPGCERTTLNDKLHADERVDVALLTVGDA